MRVGKGLIAPKEKIQNKSPTGLAMKEQVEESLWALSQWTVLLNNVWFAPHMRTSAWTHLSLTLFCFILLAPMCFSFVTCFPQLLPLLFLCLQL